MHFLTSLHLGAAIATVASQGFSLLLAIVYLKKRFFCLTVASTAIIAAAVIYMRLGKWKMIDKP